MQNLSINLIDYIKRTISEAVFSGPSQFFAIQSNICKDSLENTNADIKENSLATGNLIFSNTRGKLIIPFYLLIHLNLFMELNF